MVKSSSMLKNASNPRFSKKYRPTYTKCEYLELGNRWRLQTKSIGNLLHQPIQKYRSQTSKESIQIRMAWDSRLFVVKIRILLIES